MKYEARIDLSNKNNSHTLAYDKIYAHSSGRRLKILEVGCSAGYFGASLVEIGHEVWGVEPCEDAAKVASTILHQVYVGLIEDFFLDNSDVRFDVIVFGDVLEHLIDPEAALRLSAGFLTYDGIVVVSVPNVAHVAIRAMMLEGRWDYSDLGILDRTHLRFFTRATLIDLFSKAGYKVLSLNAVRLPAEQVNELCNLGVSKDYVKHAQNLAIDGRGDDFQYVLSSQPIDPSLDCFAINAKFKSENGIRVLCLVGDPASSIVDIRVRAPLNCWADMYGGQVIIESIYNDNALNFAWADVILFQREASGYIYFLAKRLKSFGKKVVFEIDDLLTNLPPFLSHHKASVDLQLCNLEELFKIVDAVSVSTDVLGAKLVDKVSNIHVTPNYSEAINIQASHFNVGADEVKLIVASSDKVLVDMLIQPLLVLQDKMDVKVIAIGPPGERLVECGVKVERYPNMSHLDFKNFIASNDNGIGLIPLDSSEFSSCKSAVKYFDYSMCGIPCICSNVIPYLQVIENGQNGLLVDNVDDQWINAITMLVNSCDLRMRLAESAKNKVARQHCIDISAQSWQLLFDSLCISFDQSRASRLVGFKSRPNLLHVAGLICRHAAKPSSYRKAFVYWRRYGLMPFLQKVVHL